MAMQPSAKFARCIQVKRERKHPLPLAAAFKAAKAAGFQCVTCEFTHEGTMILRAGPAQDDKVGQADDTKEIIL